MTAGNQPQPKLTKEELKVLYEIYDKNKDNTLSDEELNAIIKDAKENKNLDPRVKEILQKYDDNKDGIIDDNELKAAVADIKLSGIYHYIFLIRIILLIN